jgi:hypothetical protein
MQSNKIISEICGASSQFPCPFIRTPHCTAKQTPDKLIVELIILQVRVDAAAERMEKCELFKKAVRQIQMETGIMLKTWLKFKRSLGALLWRIELLHKPKQEKKNYCH